MRALKTTIALSLAALTLGLAAAPASAHPFPHHHGFWGPGIAFGVIGAIVAEEIVSHDCVRYIPVYDSWGNYAGRRPVNEC